MKRLGRRETPVPAVVAVEGHRLAVPVRRGLHAPDDRRGQDVVPLAKNIRPDINGFAGNAFDRVTTAIDTGIDVFNAKTRPRRIVWRQLPSALLRYALYSSDAAFAAMLFHWSPIVACALIHNRRMVGKFHPPRTAAGLR